MAGENLCFGNMEVAFEQWAEQGGCNRGINVFGQVKCTDNPLIVPK